jgi:hypothetical protein
MGKVEIEVKLKTDSAVKNSKELQKSVKGVADETEKVTANTEELGGQLDNVTGGAITKFKGLKGTLKGVIGSFKTLKGAIIATGIGALIIAVTSLTAAFTSSEQGQNRFAKILSQLGVVAGNVGDIFYSLGDVIYNVFTGNFDEAGKAFDTFQDRIKNFGKETTKEIALAGELADKIADANKLERELLIERAKTNVEINKLKTKAAEVDKFTAEQRIAFLEKAAALEDEITAKEVGLAETRRDIKIQENTLSESKKEDLDEEAQLIANVISLEEQRLIKNKELLGVAAGLRKAEADAKANERKAELDAIQKQSDEINKIQIKGIEEQKIATADLNNLKNQSSLQEQAQDELTNQQKLDLTSQTLGGITALLGENSAAGKAAAIAQATINSYLGFTEVLKTPTTIPEPFGSIQKTISAAGVLASGIKTVKEITSVKIPTGGGMKGSRGASSAPSPPSFNVVGSSPENQLAQTIGQDKKEPVKAYVVSNDVTNAQALDRNIVNGASLG